MTADPRVEAVAAALDTHYQRLTMDSVYQCACGVRGYRSEWPHHLAAVAVAQVNLLAPPETTEAVVEAAVARAVLAERVLEAAQAEIERLRMGWNVPPVPSLLSVVEAENALLRAANERVGAMAEWMAEVIVDAREACDRTESIQPQGSSDWVESGIAMRKTVLYEVRKVLNRERTAHPSALDRVEAERDEARAALDRVRVLCAEAERDQGCAEALLNSDHVRAAIEGGA